MSIFKPVTLTWDGTEYVIKEGRILPTIAQVEEIITYTEVCLAQVKNAQPIAKLSQALGVMLREAGAPVSDDQIYMEAMRDKLQSVTSMVAVLLSLMIPPEVLAEKQARAEQAGKSKGGNSS